MDQNEPAEVVTDEAVASPTVAPVVTASVTAAKAAAERRCIISGEHGERADLIRLALADVMLQARALLQQAKVLKQASSKDAAMVASDARKLALALAWEEGRTQAESIAGVG